MQIVESENYDNHLSHQVTLLPEKFILYSPENINNIISFILNIFINNNVIKNKTNYNSKIINEKPYNIVFFNE